MYKLSTYSSLSLIILKDLRGKNTQVYMSELLGKNYNVYHRWESGEQRIKLSNFLELLDVCDVSVQSKILRSFSIRYKNNLTFIKSFLKKHPILNQKIILKHLRMSETSLWRIENGKRDLFLDEFLLLANYQTQRVNVFLQEIGLDINYKMVKTLDSTVEKLFLAYIKNPELSVIGSAIYLKSVKSKKSKEQKLTQISLSTSLSLSHVKKIVNELLFHKVLVWDETGNLEFNYFENYFSTNREKEVFNSLRTYIVKKLNQKLKDDFHKTERFHFRIASISSEGNKLIDDELARCSKRISNIIEEDCPDSRTQIIGFISTKLNM